MSTSYGRLPELKITRRPKNVSLSVSTDIMFLSGLYVVGVSIVTLLLVVIPCVVRSGSFVRKRIRIIMSLRGSTTLRIIYLLVLLVHVLGNDPFVRKYCRILYYICMVYNCIFSVLCHCCFLFLLLLEAAR